MKFESRKDPLISFVIYSLISFAGAMFVIGMLKGNLSTFDIAMYGIVLSAAGLLLWFFLGTEYEISKSNLLYKSGPLNGKIEINTINKIEMGKSMPIGFRPATAGSGLIIHYNSDKKIYISPETNESLVKKILEINPKIVILKN